MGTFGPHFGDYIMIKKDKNFKLSKSIKRMMGAMPKEESSEFKRLMIQATISGSIEPPREKKKDKRKVIEVEE
jgi:hypothetical protein